MSTTIKRHGQEKTNQIHQNGPQKLQVQLASCK